jgi:predicted nucleotidyltransferase
MDRTEKSPFHRGGIRLGSLFWKAAVVLGLWLGVVSVGEAATKYITAVATAAPLATNWTTWSTTTLNTSNNAYANTGTNSVATGTLCGFDFSAIPSTAVIEGIQVDIEASESNAAVNGYLLTSVSSNSGTNYSATSRSPDGSAELATTDTGYVEGNSTTTWGINWTTAAVKSTLRLRVWAYDSSSTGGYVTRVDSITVTVYYDDTPPSARSDFTAVQSSTASGQINLSWTAPGDNGALDNFTGNYRIQYATYTAAWSTSSTPADATTVTIATTSVSPGSAVSLAITDLPLGTYYFVMWGQDNVNHWSGISNTTSTVGGNWFDLNQIELDGAGGGLYNSGVAWGDYDNDGDLDVLTSGQQTSGSTRELRIYKNNGNGTIDATQIEVDGAGGGLANSSVAWGDYDSDGDLDVLASGQQTSGSTRELRIYKNNGNGTIDATQIEVDGAGGGPDYGGLAWGDYDNDGDLDVLMSGGLTAGTRQLRIYKNNGNGTMDAAEIDLDGIGGGLRYGGVAWGDYDSDGDLDVLASGYTIGSTQELRIYKNLGNGTISATQIDVDGASGGLWYSNVAWGDYDTDGDIDVLASGYTLSSTRELRIYKNNGNGTIAVAQIEVDGAGGGLIDGGVAWGDYDNDGDLDVLASGYTATTRELRVYKNNGNGTMDAAQIDLDGAGGGLRYGGVGWGDYDNDGDVDVLASGEQTSGSTRELRIYNNFGSLVQPNTAPTAPNTLSAGMSLSYSGISVASITWNAGTDSGTGATSENGLAYDIQISTTSDFSKLTFPGQLGASPRMGSYFKPPKIFNGNTSYGVVLKSTDPWNTQARARYGLRTDTTYYYRVKTVDSALAESSWSSAGTLNTGVSPSTSTLASAAGASAGEVVLSWTSPGDDAMSGALTGNYRIQYATYTAAWSTNTTPPNATTVTVSTSAQAAGSAQSRTITGLLGSVTYSFVLWSQDEKSNWSGISNTTTQAIPFIDFDSNQLELTGIEGNSVAWGDFDNDGDVDVLAGGYAGGIQLRVSINNGNGTFNPTPLEVDGLNGGLRYGGVGWGDFDNDGDLDIAETGMIGSGDLDPQCRVYKNNGNGTFDPAQIEVDGINGGLYDYGRLAWGDFDSDGDLDLMISGTNDEGSTAALRVYRNNGNGTLDATQIDIDGVSGGTCHGVAWGDFDKDADLDILASGWSLTGSQLRVYKNNGNGTFDFDQIEVDGLNNGLGGQSAWGDMDADGDMDIVVTGYEGAPNQLRIYQNNGNGTIDPNQIEVDGVADGLRGGVCWGDFDNDGDLDILMAGSDGTNGQLRVYKSNGNATFDPTQTEVDGLNGGLIIGSTAWGDFDNDSDLDILVGGTSSGVAKLRVYTNQSVTPNTGPTAPDTLTSAWDYNALGISTATFKWSPGSDGGASPTPENVLTYQVEISSDSGFTGKSVVAGQWTTPGMGNYLKPPLIFDGNTTHGVTLHYLPATNTTYYYRVKTIDAGLKESAWSATGSLYTAVTSLVPSVVTDLVASNVVTDGQIVLTWTEPVNIASAGSAEYDVRYRTSGAITNDGEFNAATAAIGEPTPGSPGAGQTMIFSGLVPGVTYYFALKWSNVNGTSELDVSTPRPSAVANDFDLTEINVDGAEGGLNHGGVAWGDYDNDGDLDVLTSGQKPIEFTSELRIYKNNGNGTMDATQIEVDGEAGGVAYSNSVAWGDYDNDGDLDVLASGQQSSEYTEELRIYKNNGNGTMDATQIEVDEAGGGLDSGGVTWGDYDSDGDLDVLVSGIPDNGNTRELRIYKNNGNGTMNAAQIEVDGADGGLRFSSVAWGDYDSDGDLDVLASGQQTSGSTEELRIYKNNGNGTIDATQVEVDGSGDGLQDGGVVWGDYDMDGDLDLLASGQHGVTRELRVYKNNGNGTMDAAQIEVDGAGGGLAYGGVAWGDYDNDGDLDVLTSGQETGGSTLDLRVYKNNGNGTIDATQISLDGWGSGLAHGGVAWGDYDNDEDIDVLISGDDGVGALCELRIYNSLRSLAQANTTPTAPSTLTGGLTFNSTGISVASMTWNAGTDSGTGATSENGLTYDIQISTTSNFSKLMFPGQMGASPRMGSYLKPPKIFNGNTSYGVVMKSTDPWNAQSTASYGLRTDTTYYYRVKTVDSALAESAWSSAGIVNTGVSPSTSTVSSTEGAGAGEAVLSWTSAGDDGMIGSLTGHYRIQYATYTATWSTSTTPANATTVTVSTTAQTPGSPQSHTITGLSGGVTYSFVLWSQDDASNWSGISNTSTLSLSAAGGFDSDQIEVDGAGLGVTDGSSAWGDYDNDGDIDILVSGADGSGAQLRIYKNNGNGTFNPAQIEVDLLNGGLGSGGVAWGDHDNDGDIDILVNGYNGSSRELRVYRNNGNGTIDATQIEVDGSGNGLRDGDVAWGDFDNDGDMDILTSGTTATTKELRIYKNNGNGTFNPSQIEVDGSGNGLMTGSVAWGDYDNDGDLDVLANGVNGTVELRIYKNNGNGTMDPSQVEVDGAGNGLQSRGLAWGDFDSDGDLDILISGQDPFDVAQLRVYKNNGNGTLNPTQIEVTGFIGLINSSVAWGDFDNDGNLDVLASGRIDLMNDYGGELRVYKNNGNGTINPTPIDVEDSIEGVYYGDVAWGDFDNDSDLDVVVSGTDGTDSQLRVYKNLSATANTEPTAPSVLLGGFTYNAAVSIASMTWNAGTDSGTGATAENGLTYDIQISTTSNFSKLMFPGQWGASPRMGSYLKPPKIFNGNTSYGVVLKSTDPWNAQTTASYGLRTDTTYYYRVKTVDSALAESAWSSAGTSYTGVAPSTSTLAAAATLNDGELVLTWNSAGDDGMIGNLTGNYRIQYATFTASWSTSTTPADATTVTISTSNVVPGVSRSISVDVALIVEHYFVIWTQDEANNWSVISGTASATPFLGVRSMTIVSGSPLAFGSVNLGTQVVASTGVVVRNNGNLLNSYTLRASTYTAGTPWSVSNSPPAGPDALVVYGVYDDVTAPVLGDFGVEDLIETSAQVGSETKFSVSGAITGTSVPAGEDRPLWIRLDMPTTSRTVAPQSIRIEISAQPP